MINTSIGKNNTEYNLLNCYDFRPYANPVVPYTLGAADSTSAPNVGTIIEAGIQIASDSNISATQSYYMSCIDSIVLDEFGVISLYEGGEAENPSRPEITGLYALNNILIPGNNITRSILPRSIIS